MFRLNAADNASLVVAKPLTMLLLLEVYFTINLLCLILDVLETIMLVFIIQKY
nr:MAG TPA: hypothetical protein [Crassvirales sp.]